MGSVDIDRNRDGLALTVAAARSLRRTTQTNGILGRQRVGPGRRQGEDGHVDALGVHRRDPARTEVFQALLDGRPSR